MLSVFVRLQVIDYNGLSASDYLFEHPFVGVAVETSEVVYGSDIQLLLARFWIKEQDTSFCTYQFNGFLKELTLKVDIIQGRGKNRSEPEQGVDPAVGVHFVMALHNSRKECALAECILVAFRNDVLTFLHTDHRSDM